MTAERATHEEGLNNTNNGDTIPGANASVLESVRELHQEWERGARCAGFMEKGEGLMNLLGVALEIAPTLYIQECILVLGKLLDNYFWVIRGAPLFPQLVVNVRLAKIWILDEPVREEVRVEEANLSLLELVVEGLPGALIDGFYRVWVFISDPRKDFVANEVASGRSAPGASSDCRRSSARW